MNYRVISVANAPTPPWVTEHLTALPPKPARRTVYLLSAPPRKNFPALVYDPEKASLKPALYYDPGTLSPCQIELAYARYRLKQLRLHRLRHKVLQKAHMLYVLINNKGELLDFNAAALKSAREYLGITLRKGIPCHILTPPDNRVTFQNDLQMALQGYAVHNTYHLSNLERALEVTFLPLTTRRKPLVACLALDVTLSHQLVENFASQRELSELAANALSEGILTIRKDGGLLYANLPAESMLGPDIADSHLFAHLAENPEGYLTLREHLIQWTTRPLPSNDILLVLLRDITPFYRSEQENYILRQAWGIGPTGIAIFKEDSEGLAALYTNPRIQEWFPSQTEPIWSQIQKHLNKNMRHHLKQIVRAGERGEILLKGAYYRQGWSHLRLYLYPLVLPPLEVFPPDSPPPVWTGRVWIAIVQDETLLHQMARRRLISEARQTQRILQAQEQERQRLAEALHDQVGALLSVTRMSLTTLLSDAPPSLHDKIQNLLHQMDEVIRAVRLTSHLLMPPLVEHFGLRSIVESLVRRFDQASAGMNFHLLISGEEPPLTTQQKLALYRIIQELLTNALKHSGAKDVTVCLRFKARSLIMEVKDNGHGYDPRTLPSSGGIGLQNIEARLKLLKATYINRSEPGGGAYFHIEVPLRRRASLGARQ